MFLWEKKKTLFYYVRKMNLNMESGCMKSEQMEMCLGFREYEMVIEVVTRSGILSHFF
jgi:hypothetical protein